MPAIWDWGTGGGGGPRPPWVLRQEMLEAAFRYFHVQWRCHAEEVAFQDQSPLSRWVASY